MSSSMTQSFQIDPAELPPDPILFGSTDPMRAVWNKIKCVADNDLPVLIRGESGTGKELIARFLHTRSNRRHAPFVKVNCAAMPGGLLESELMGYEKGAFTGADKIKRGLIELAGAGTLFLDEIGDMELALQRKFLHLLQDGHYTRIGGFEELQSHARIVSATNVEMEAALGSQAFRKDLFYRIDVISLHLAPLRERREDIPQLCKYFMQKLATKFERSTQQLTPNALRLLMQWSWPGNIRELENWIARVVILGGEQVPIEELHGQIESAREMDDMTPNIGRLKGATWAAAQAEILKALQANHGNRAKTAKDLKMSYRSLLYKLREAEVYSQDRDRDGLPPLTGK
jgi:two-component system response regulator AtoC